MPDAPSVSMKCAIREPKRKNKAMNQPISSAATTTEELREIPAENQSRPATSDEGSFILLPMAGLIVLFFLYVLYALFQRAPWLTGGIVAVMSLMIALVCLDASRDEQSEPEN
jgi:hypothetical protein